MTIRNDKSGRDLMKLYYFETPNAHKPCAVAKYLADLNGKSTIRSHPGLKHLLSQWTSQQIGKW